MVVFVRVAIALAFLVGFAGVAHAEPLACDLPAVVDMGNGPMPAVPQSNCYTAMERAGDFLVPQNKRRLAVLVGNNSYDQAPPRKGESAETVSLGPLTGPCGDVIAVARRLASLGWRKSEIFVLCNQGNDEVSSIISKLVSTIPMGDEPKRLTVLYLAGHGMMIGGRNYYFGVDTRMDFGAKARRAMSVLQQDRGDLVFDRTEAVDLTSAFSGFKTEDYLSAPFLVIVDACRNNGLLKYAMDQTKAVSGLNTADARLARMLMSRMASIQPIWTPPHGLQFVYATKPSDTILDDAGSGGSRLAAALANDIVSDLPIRIMLFKMQKDFRAANPGLPTAARQDIGYDGDLQIDEDDDWCLQGCALPGPASLAGGPAPRYAQAARLAFPWSARALTDAGGQSDQNADARKPPSIAKKAPARGKVQVVRRYPVTAARPVVVDVFWCSGDADADARRAKAEASARSIVERLDADNSLIGSSQIYTVRLRELTGEENAASRNQRSMDALYVDSVKTEPEENRLAVKYIPKDLLKVRQVDTPSRDLISVFFCADAFKGPKSPRVFLQVATRTDLGLASKMQGILQDSAPDLSIEPKVQVMSDMPRYNMALYPGATVIRTANAGVLDRAKALAATLSQAIGQPVTAVCILGCKADGGRAIELWVGNSSATKSSVMNAFEPFTMTLKSKQ
jgi:hypothetical protein